MIIDGLLLCDGFGGDGLRPSPLGGAGAADVSAGRRTVDRRCMHSILLLKRSIERPWNMLLMIINGRPLLPDGVAGGSVA